MGDSRASMTRCSIPGATRSSSQTRTTKKTPWSTSWPTSSFGTFCPWTVSIVDSRERDVTQADRNASDLLGRCLRDGLGRSSDAELRARLSLSETADDRTVAGALVSEL